MSSSPSSGHIRTCSIHRAIRRGLVTLRCHIPAWTVTAVTVVAILWLTLARTPLPETEIPLIPGADKIVHAVMFGWLTLVICWDWYITTHSRLSAPRIAVCAIISILFGGAVELAQGAMGCGRSADIWDFTADTIGALTVMAALLRRP